MVSCVPKRWRKQPSGTAKRFWAFSLVFGRQKKQTSESIKGTWADLFSLTMTWILESCTTAVRVSIWFCEFFWWFLRQTRLCRRPSGAAENLIVVLLDVRRSFDPLLAKLLAADPQNSTVPCGKNPVDTQKKPTLSFLVTKNADQLSARTWWHPAAYVPKMAFHQKLCKFGLRRAVDLWGAFTSAPTHVRIDHFSLTIWFAHLGTNWTGCSLVMWTSQFWWSKKVLAVRTVLSTDTRRILQKMRKQLASGIYLHFPRLYIIVTCHTVWYYTIAYSLICCYVLLYQYTVVYIVWYL